MGNQRHDPSAKETQIGSSGRGPGATTANPRVELVGQSRIVFSCG